MENLQEMMWLPSVAPPIIIAKYDIVNKILNQSLRAPICLSYQGLDDHYFPLCT
jgi:hypothetical protein